MHAQSSKMKEGFISKSGFTLVESMLAVLLFGMIFGAVMMINISGTENWNANETQLQLQQNMRLAIARLSDDLRQAGTSSVVNVTAGGAVQNSIVFRTVTGVNSGTAQWSANTITYDVNSNQLRRTVGLGTPSVSATNISSASFERKSSTPDIVDVIIMGSKDTFRGRTMTITGSFSVQLRNG